ncbi:hypothetical protein XACS584_110119 [Xanthomonas citri pv. citri]|nr:hypothetical protein XACS584_110119 [Xanthomonas citri pv. citri]CEE54834.1 hypothetical protein XAC3608_130075 [Xanthomonas citri pv. citri]
MHPSTDGGNVHPTRCVLPPSRTLERVMHVEMGCVGRQRCGADAARRRLGWRQTKPRGAHSAPLAANPPGSCPVARRDRVARLARAASLGRSARLVSTRHRTLRTHLNVHNTLWLVAAACHSPYPSRA